MTAEASAEPPRVEGAILLLVTLGEAAPHPLMVVHVDEAAHGRFRGVVVVSPQDSIGESSTERRIQPEFGVRSNSLAG